MGIEEWLLLVRDVLDKLLAIALQDLGNSPLLVRVISASSPGGSKVVDFVLALGYSSTSAAQYDSRHMWGYGTLTYGWVTYLSLP